ncbi:helix-turn-helix domain-containing protein [Bradyrhizobium prioriisuperbiae]|uniref:TetR/AcrR family transcriptional regulator n=1 Tax=Bradyrhizobium prioriisuperbiae TaxID=2854389 RepID=UPI0028E1882A|nr:helix-turn-helix domain-containing protein [Bradyrhizobium prioritasuperba]
MKVSKERAAENRERILDEASRLFRERGVQGVGVDALGEAAGLTHGSLYSQFGSKDRLLAEAVGRAFASFGAKVGTIDDADAYVSEYLSAAHRENPGDGCAVAALGSEMPRQSEAVRKVFTDAVLRSRARVARLLLKRRGREPEDDALAMLATMAGAMMLARAVDDPELSDRILEVCRQHLQRAA